MSVPGIGDAGNADAIGAIRSPVGGRAAFKIIRRDQADVIAAVAVIFAATVLAGRTGLALTRNRLINTGVIIRVPKAAIKADITSVIAGVPMLISAGALSRGHVLDDILVA